jgi:ATPase family associated with various cellular activities (AAA)/Double zinc ribbon
MRHIFTQAKKNAPCLLMLDELDVLRSTTNEEDHRLVNHLLFEIDELGRRQRVAVIATASQLDTLDKALFRVGRFDQRVVVRRPDSDAPKSVGAKFIAPEGGAEQLPVCPSCEREVQPQWKHCVYCGAPLAKVCPKCGALRADVEGAKFCFECGYELL